MVRRAVDPESNVEEIIAPQSSVTNTLFVSVAGEDYQQSLETLGLTFESTESEILTVVRPIIQEQYNEDIKDGRGWLFKVRKAVSNQNIYVIPNSTAGLE